MIEGKCAGLRAKTVEVSGHLPQDLARYYTLTSEELELVNRRRRPTSDYVEYFSTYLPLGGIPMLLIAP